MMKYAILLLTFFSLSFHATYSQWQKNWRDYFSYRDCRFVAEDGNHILAATSNGVMIYDYLSGEIRTLSRISGLSDIDITAMAPVGPDQYLIAYENGNIDLIRNNRVYNIPDLKNKQLEGSKKINHFLTADDQVYASTDFGILVINLDKIEISDTYYPGINSANLTVYQCASDDEFVYAATDRGLLRAELNDPQIGYYEAWQSVGPYSGPCYAAGLFNNSIITVERNNTGQVEVQYGQTNQWTTLTTAPEFTNLALTQQQLTIGESNRIRKYDLELSLLDSLTGYSAETGDNAMAVNQAFFSQTWQSYFIADRNKGMAIVEPDRTAFVLPDGPYSNNCFGLLATSAGVYSIAGGLTFDYNNLNRNLEYSFLSQGVWSSFRSTRQNGEQSWRDAIRLCSDPLNDDKVYLSSWGGGLFELTGDSVSRHYDQFNSGLQNIDWTGSNYYVRVGGIATDPKGNVWMSNSEVEYGIVVREAADTSRWHQFSYETLNNLHSTGQILFSRDNYLWVIIPRAEKQGLVVINTNGTFTDESDDRYRGVVPAQQESDGRNAGLMRIWDESLNIITNTIYCLAEDTNGYMWLGTDKGVVVYYRPWTIFNEDYPVASRIKVPRNDGTNQADYLLEKEKITCIAVDGANRKWIGTQTSGLYLVSEDGLNTFEAFNTDNSPLPSNYITSLAIDPLSGEVFIGTSKGLVSYKGKASEGTESFSNIYAYPNPVREDFNGEICITGLMSRSNVKITTTSGKLVSETRSLGGKAYWNGRNLQGRKVSSGVYIVYVTAEDGSAVASTKILIVR